MYTDDRGDQSVKRTHYRLRARNGIWRAKSVRKSIQKKEIGKTVGKKWSSTRSNNSTRFCSLIGGVREARLRTLERDRLSPDPNMIALDASKIIDEIQSLRYRDFGESARGRKLEALERLTSHVAWISRICSQCSSYLKPYDVEAWEGDKRSRGSFTGIPSRIRVMFGLSC